MLYISPSFWNGRLYKREATKCCHATQNGSRKETDVWFVHLCGKFDLFFFTACASLPYRRRRKKVQDDMIHLEATMRSFPRFYHFGLRASIKPSSLMPCVPPLSLTGTTLVNFMSREPNTMVLWLYSFYLFLPLYFIFISIKKKTV